MRELILSRLTEYIHENRPQHQGLFKRYGLYYTIFYGEQEKRRPAIYQVQSKTLNWYKSLSDKDLLHHFEMIIVLGNRG